MDVFDFVSEYDSVVSVFESKMNMLHTTHSWDFLRLDSVYKSNRIALDSTSDVIVGVIDSGNSSFDAFSFFSFIWITMTHFTWIFRGVAGIGKLQ
jgi:hypothetical protein